ncbi:GDSL-type esterase/lipase family protein [Phycisphaeraceae bacterium D3-23]
MKHLPRALLILFALALPIHAQDADTERPDLPVRVACVGDGITYGTGLPERERWCYPALLQDMLGDGYDVQNFGVEQATTIAAGDHPYSETQAYRDALDFEPDVVIIMLGTHDTQPDNWEHYEDFIFDYEDMVAAFREHAEAPRVLLCVPPPTWTEERAEADRLHRSPVNERVRLLGSRTSSEQINLHDLLIQRRDWFPDGVHPNSFGAELIAKRVYEQLMLRQDVEFDISQSLEGLLEEDVDWLPFYAFAQGDIRSWHFSATILRPRVVAEGRPWVWRARFWRHEPQADYAMLERGWHVVYCDVSNLYGNPEAVERWDTFYQLMRDAGLGEDLVLEGMSRGGLIIYNWAKANPEKVCAIYGDAPVCDIRSWPGGLGVGRGSTEGQFDGPLEYIPSDWETALDAYGLTEDDIANFTGNPIDGLEPLAEHGVPLLHVVGEADDVVPVSENTAILEERYRALGGDITVIRKPGVGHHPHALSDPTPIVDFFLEATGRKVNFATVARPSVEFRAGAGWGNGTWWTQHEHFNALGEQHDLDVVFIGDSITQSFTGVADRLGHEGGGRTFDRAFGDLRAAGFGLAGDRTEHLLYRIANGNFDHIDPKVVVLMIGVNNINAAGNTGEQTAQGTRAVVAALREKVPGAHVIVLGCFPTGPRADSPNRRAVDVLHDNIADIGDADDQVTYLDLRPLFLNEDGTLNGNMRGDAIHLTGAGYVAWADAIGPVIRELLAE